MFKNGYFFINSRPFQNIFYIFFAKIFRHYRSRIDKEGVDSTNLTETKTGGIKKITNKSSYDLLVLVFLMPSTLSILIVVRGRTD